MPFLFPFEGGHVEVLSTLGVRYQGVLKKVDGENRCITLTNVHHFGSETRAVEGVATISAKGALPADEERCIYAIYVSGVRRIPPLPSPPLPSPPPPLANSAAHQPPTVTVPSGEVESVHKQAAAPMCASGTSAAAKNLSFWSSFEQLAHHLSNRINQDDENNQQYEDAAKLEVPKVNDGDGCKHPVSDGDDGGEPTYFLAQHHPPYFTGILTNAARHPSAPVYVGFDAVDMARIATPRIGQLWEAPNCEWTPNGQRFVNEHYVAGRDHDVRRIQHFDKRRGMPWISDHHINLQAKATPLDLRLVGDVEMEWRWGRVVRSRVDPIGKHYVRVANLRHAIDGVEILVEAPNSRDGAVEFKSDEDVEVEMVRLPTGCWVGPRFVLPNLDADNGNDGYHDEKPPFRPDAIARSLDFLKRSERGDYFPVGVRPASTMASTVPVYFIAQRLHDMAVGVLLKQGTHPWAPIFVAFPCASLIHGEVVRPGQKWRFPAPVKATYRFVHGANRDRRITPKIDEENGLLCMDAELRSHIGMELVKSAELKVRKGRIKRLFARDRLGAVRKNSHVEVEAKGAVGGVRLGKRQFDGLLADFLALAEGDYVEVEMVRLEEGCWVGPNYLLPDIYGGADQQSELRERGTVRARSGDYMPVGIRKPPRSDRASTNDDEKRNGS